MRIQVLEVLDDDQRTVVRFACESGLGLAVWRGESSPQTGRKYDIEFTLKQDVALGQTAVVSARHTCALASRDGKTVLTGVMEGMNEDIAGLAYFRLSEDGLVMVETVGDGIKTGMWLTLTVPVESLEMYDYNL